MDTNNYDRSPSRWFALREMGSVCSKPWFGFGLVLAFFLCGLSEGSATVAYPSDLGQYAILSKGSSFGVNGTTINGNVGVIGGGGSNGDTINNANLIYSDSVPNGVTVNNGSKTQNALTLQNTMTAAALYSGSIASLAFTQAFTDNNSKIPTITGNGGVNVIKITSNVSQAITLTGGANDIFYINVLGNFDLSGVVLNGSVTANHVLWNILGGNDNLGGTLKGTFLSFSGGNPAGISLQGNTTVYGSLVGGNMSMNNATINGVGFSSLEATAMAPEASSKAAMAAFALFLLGSSSFRFWRTQSRKTALA